MSNRRLEILNGKLYAPKQIRELVQNSTFDRFFESLWNNYLMKSDSTTSLAYWSDEFNDNKAFNTALYHLSKAGWIITNVIPMRNWGTVQLDPSKLLQWVDKDTLLEVRKEFKYNKYIMTNQIYSDVYNKTKTSKGIQDVGLVRKGIAKSGNSEFKYDTTMIHKYLDAVVSFTTRSIEKAIAKHQIDIDGADYKSVSRSIVEMHMYSPEKRMTLGNSYTDSRGRAISTSLSKVFNPIGNKIARSLLIGPEVSLDENAIGEIYLAVAELLGLKRETIEQRKLAGMAACKAKTLPNLDISTEEGEDELYELIWLERIYTMFDNYDGSNWNVPLEFDMTASVIAITGALLNDYNMWDETNMIYGGKLKDVWSKGIDRKQFKYAATPLLYGSSQPCTALWKKKKVKYTVDDIKLFNKELTQGTLGLANDFKDYIIGNVDPKPVMNVVVGDDTFKVYCNKYHAVGEYVKKYPLYDTALDSVLTINHTHTEKVADLEQFKLYFQTLLIHGIDSQAMDYTVAELEWSIPIYDAVITMPNSSKLAKKRMATFMDKIRSNRVSILGNYFDSIGIKKTIGNMKQLNAVMAKVTPIAEDIKCDITCMK